MNKPVVDDISGQLYLFGSSPDQKEKRTSEKEDSMDWLDDGIEQERIGLAKVFSCNPATCTDNCNKCRIFGGR